MKELIRKMRQLSALAANTADRIDGHTVTVHRGQAVKVKSVEQPHQGRHRFRPRMTRRQFQSPRLSSICRDFSHAIEGRPRGTPEGYARMINQHIDEMVRRMEEGALTS